MGCCNGPGKTIRKQVIQKPASNKQVVVKRIHRDDAPVRSQKIIVNRQHISSLQKCHKCGFPAMVVNIAGRERYQCSNHNCKIIIK